MPPNTTAPSALFGRWGWASACAACGTWPALPHGDALCGPCEALLAPSQIRCPRCALAHANPASPPTPGGLHCPGCLGPQSPLAACATAVDYAEPWRHWIHRFKHHSEPEWARLFARLMLQRQEVTNLLTRSTAWLPVPMANRALASRGFNPAWELARHLQKAWPHRPHAAQAHWLEKTRDTAAQHTLGRNERLANLQHAFAPTPVGTRGLHGQSVALIDDVMTTGTTLESAARVLLKAGAREVVAVVFARTPAPGADAEHAA